MMTVQAMTRRAPGARTEPTTLRVTFGASSLGVVLVARSADGIAAVALGDDRDTLRDELRQRFPRAELVESDSTSDPLTAEVVRCIETPGRALDAALDPRGSEFQRDVWSALREIPVGETTTYTELAARIGRPAAVRAVAQACAANPLAVLVPCHRVVRRDGSLSGYRWGVERKRELLTRESAGRSPA
jgi:AraC family transcriptional regulator of adaptative response/methylated-DNA-[protein]-cysteine methyltransferase